jgi:hypothetical protein
MLSLVVALVGTTALAVLVMLAARRYAPADGFLRDPGSAVGVFGVLGVAFAVILAFVVFLAFEGYLRAGDGASREAVAVTQLARTTRLLPDPEGAELRGVLTCYARATVSDEWTQMAAGGESALVEEWLARLESTVDDIAVDSPRTEVALAHWLDQAAERREGRRARLLQADPAVPEAVWLLLLSGAVLTIGYMVVFANRRDRWWVQALMIGSVNLIVVAGLLVVFILDRPYQRDGAYVAPSEMQTSIRLIELEFGGDASFQPPCDAQGRAVG